MERLLIAKIKKTESTRAELFGKGHRYPDLHLFDLGELLTVGIDPADLEIGEEIPVRFWALYELSEKLNQAGNPYKDVVALEPFDKPATVTSTDTSEIVAELRAIKALLAAMLQGTGDPIPVEVLADQAQEPPPGKPLSPEPDPSEPSELDRFFPRDDAPTQDPPPKATTNGSKRERMEAGTWFGHEDKIPQSPADLHAMVQAYLGPVFPKVRDLFDALTAEVEGPKAWPTSRETWRQASNRALQLGAGIYNWSADEADPHSG